MKGFSLGSGISFMYFWVFILSLIMQVLPTNFDVKQLQIITVMVDNNGNHMVVSHYGAMQS